MFHNELQSFQGKFIKSIAVQHSINAVVIECNDGSRITFQAELDNRQAEFVEEVGVNLICEMEVVTVTKNTFTV